MTAGLLPLHLLILPLLAIIPLAYILRSRRRRRDAGLRLPPGPWALPAIGHLHHLAGGLPLHHKLRDLSRRHGPLMLLRFGELPVVVASSPAAAREITKTHDLTFATRAAGPAARLVGEAMSNAAYGETWRQLRKISTLELLSARRVQTFRAAREDEVARLLRAVTAAAASSSSPVDLGGRIASYVADATARAIIGSRFKDRARFFRLMEKGLDLFSRPSLPDLYPSSRLAMLISRKPGQIKRLHEEMMAFIDTIIMEHQIQRADDDGKEEDLIDVLLRIQRDGDQKFPLSPESIKNVVADLFIAGSETSATVLQWAMSELMRNPRVMEKAQNEVRRVLKGQDRVTEDCLSSLHYLHLVVKETLRLHPSAPLLVPRQCRSPCQILGFDVPVGATVFVNAWAIGRDPAHWDAPEEFMPERFEGKDIDFKGTDFEYIPFGAGRRMCPGSAFGLANIDLALASLLYHFDWNLPQGTLPGDLDMTEVFGAVMRRKADLLLVPVVRVPV